MSYPLQMNPNPAGIDMADLAWVNAVPSGDLLLSHMAPLAVTPDGENLGRRQLGHPVVTADVDILAEGAASDDMAVFGNHIGTVIGVGAKEQVAWSDAHGVVALVQDAESVRDRCVSEFPTDAVGPFHVSVYFDRAVTTAGVGAKPEPTGVISELGDLEPEAFFDRDRCYGHAHRRVT